MISKRGQFRCRIFDHGNLVNEFVFPNGMTTVGLTSAIGVELGGATQITTWRLGLITSVGFSALAIGDTMSSHVGWTELTGYSETSRPQLIFGSASGGLIRTTSPCQFTLTGTSSILGCFVVSDATKGGTSGILRAHGQFTAQEKVAGQVLSIDYEAANTAA